MNALALCETARRVPPASPELSRKDDQPVSQILLVRASKRRVLLAGLAAAAASAGLSAAAQNAHAAFTIGPCSGSSAVKNQGASFQNFAQPYWRTVFASSNGCNGAVTLQSFLANGSGNGLASMGAGGGSSAAPFINCTTCGSANSGGGRTLPAGERDLTTSFNSTDEPPTVKQQADMNAGNPATDADNAMVHVIPAATGSTAILIHAPNGCDLSKITNKTDGLDPDGAGPMTAPDSSGDLASDKTQRLRIPNKLLEKAFAGDSDANTWGKIAPGISGTPTAGGQNNGLACADIPVKRIVRSDNSGTTYSFKAFLSLINPSRGWLTTYNASPNTTWPGAGGTGTANPVATGTGTPAPAGGAFCANTAANLLCSRNSSGGGGLADAVNATEGSIGYVDLATGRSKGFEITPATAASPTQDYTFWSPVQNNPSTPDAAGNKFVEPTVDPTSHRPGMGSRGASCGDVQVKNVPTAATSPKGDPTLGDWSQAFAAGGTGYANCVLTYILAWDDNAPVYGNTGDEQAKARTVKDFLALAVVSSSGQQFAAQDYSPLPNPQSQPLLKIAQDGVAAIDWNKAAASGGQQQQQNQQQQPPPQQPPSITIPKVIPPLVKPSNKYTVSSGKLNSARTTITYSVKLPGGGTLSAVSTYVRRGKTVKVSKVSVSPSGASTVRLTVRLTSRARSDLRRLKRLRISTRFTYAPAGGTAASQRKAVNVRVKATKKKKKKK